MPNLKELKEDKYSDIEKHYKLTMKEALRLSKRKRQPKHWCSKTCASCLAAEARGNVDGKFNLGFIRGDISMLDVRNEIAEKLNWEIN